MIKGLMREATLAIQSKTGATTGVFIWLGLAALAALTAFVFLCITAYVWLASRFGGVPCRPDRRGFLHPGGPDRGAVRGAGAAPRQGTRDPRTRRARARRVMAVRPAHPCHRHAGGPHARLATPRSGRAAWCSGRAMGARISQSAPRWRRRRRRQIAGRRPAAHVTGAASAGQSHAAPRTPLKSPCTARTISVCRTSLKANLRMSSGSPL